ncbi:dihydrolipoamide acetyltransferase family protein [Fodinicola feengrottensis]|uniref:Dihydrolipoamide acetyltransferase component of pyruvate dehydrogenase complex n=1 Tax=Fodinicola feengrottensis TaxID=435914 RepID=A0ABP4U279_9ACTN
MPDFLLPDLGEGLTEAEIVTWHVRVGDTVTIDQAVVEVETAKAVVEVPVPFAGRVTELHGAAGEVLTVGRPLITVQENENLFVEPGIVQADNESGNVLIGYGTSAGSRRRRRDTTQTAPIPVVSPLVRRLARTAGVDLATVRGSGANGLITRRDVDQAVHPEPAGLVRVPMTGFRKVIADKLSQSRREIPEATVWVDVDATGLLRLRQDLNTTGPKISLLALFSKFAMLGLRRFPELNARIEGDEILMGPTVNLGFAAQTDRGLVVPVVPDAAKLPLEQLSMSLAERTTLAREGKLAPKDLTGGTFTLNNYGVFGVDGSAAIINHPEVAILGVGRIIDRPWAVDKQVVVRSCTQLTLAFDHRVCDGGTAGGFLRFVADCVESPTTILRHL